MMCLSAPAGCRSTGSRTPPYNSEASSPDFAKDFLIIFYCIFSALYWLRTESLWVLQASEHRVCNSKLIWLGVCAITLFVTPDFLGISGASHNFCSFSVYLDLYHARFWPFSSSITIKTPLDLHSIHPSWWRNSVRQMGPAKWTTHFSAPRRNDHQHESQSTFAALRVHKT